MRASFLPGAHAKLFLLNMCLLQADAEAKSTDERKDSADGSNNEIQPISDLQSARLRFVSNWLLA